MIDWSAWISTGSAVVSAVMAGITVWWPWHNRPQADWTLLRYSTHPDTPLSATVPGLDGWLKRRGEREPDFICGIYNSGDGAAYDVKVDSIGCKAYFLQITDDGTNTKFLTPSQIAQVESTDELLLLGFRNDDADIIAIRLIWTAQPTRLRRRVSLTYAIEGSIPKQPRYPVPKKREHYPTLLRWRFEHSRVGLWLHSKSHRWAWRTLDAPPAEDRPANPEDPRR